MNGRINRINPQSADHITPLMSDKPKTTDNTEIRRTSIPIILNKTATTPEMIRKTCLNANSTPKSIDAGIFKNMNLTLFNNTGILYNGFV